MYIRGLFTVSTDDRGINYTSNDVNFEGSTRARYSARDTLRLPRRAITIKRRRSAEVAVKREVSGQRFRKQLLISSRL
jgi:hypothetical protein